MKRGGNAGRCLAVLLLLAAGLYAAPKAAAAFKNIQGGMEAPGFSLKDLSGSEVALDAFKQEKAVLLVFFATWSERSLKELSDVEKLVAEYGPKGLKAVAVNVDHEEMTDEDRKAVRAKVEELKLSFPVLFDAGLSAFRGYGVVAVPSTAILGEGNRIRNAFNGYPTFAFRDMREQVEILLGLKKEEAASAVAKAETGHKPAHLALLNYNLGKRLYGSNMAAMAEPKVRKAAEADPAWAAPRILLGRILLEKAGGDPKRIEAAVKEFEAAAAAEPGNVVARTALAEVYWKTGAVAKAEAEADEALKIGSSYTPALLLKAKLLAKKGKIPEAEERMREAFALNPRNASSYAHAGEAYEAAGELAKAAAMYRKAWETGGE
ncbi:MAG: hypothetical protein Kow00128_23190 [Deltaproteobacteria bacterium]